MGSKIRSSRMLPPRRVNIFFYGLFMDPALLAKRGLRPKGVRRGYVADMRLELGKRAAMLPHKGERVYGVVVGLAHAEIDRLYADESLAEYRPEAVTVVHRGGRSAAALCYNLPKVTHDSIDPEYAEKLKQIARRLKLPENYVARMDVQRNDRQPRVGNKRK